MRAKYFQDLVKQVKTDEAGAMQRTQLFDLLAYLTKQIEVFEKWLHQKVECDDQVKLYHLPLETMQ